MNHSNFSPAARALGFATMAHYGQVDKAGKPYIEHPIAVAKILKQQCAGEVYQVVALLHDVVEDTPAGFQDLADCFSEEIVVAVGHVTRSYNVLDEEGEHLSYKKPSHENYNKEPYRDFIIRAKKNPISRIVKIADIQHNLSRMEALPQEKQDSLRARYEPALKFLLDDEAVTY